MKRGNRLVFSVVLLILFSFFVSGHEEEVHEEEVNIGEYVSKLSLQLVAIASVIVVFLVAISIMYEKKIKKAKKYLFLGIVIPIVIASLFLIGSTLYVNFISETKGPVHWHADFEIWNCGEKLDLVNPEGFSNKIGSSVFHEHGDDRIHVEGVVVSKSKIDLHSFFETIGGDLDKNRLEIPTDDKVVEVKDGDLCNGKPGKLQVFLYKIKN